jgi:TPR repeat protein
MKGEELKKVAYQLWNSICEDEREQGMDMMVRIAGEGDLQAIKLVAQWQYARGDIESSLKYWREAADAQDITSLMMVAQIYSEMDEMGEACAYWIRAAQLGHATAISQLARYLQSVQEGIPEPESLCFEYTKKSADLGDTCSMKLLAEWRKPTVDRESYDWYYKAARHGDSEGFLQCGRMRYQGLGVERNTRKALELFVQAARMAAAISLSDIAQSYQNGKDDMQPDYERAYQLYTEASRSDPYAYKCLGDMHLVGLGCEKDLLEAKGFYEKAVAEGCMEAMVSLSKCLMALKPPDRTEAQNLIKAYILKADIEGVKAKDLTKEALDHVLESLDGP